MNHRNLSDDDSESNENLKLSEAKLATLGSYILSFGNESPELSEWIQGGPQSVSRFHPNNYTGIH